MSPAPDSVAAELEKACRRLVAEVIDADPGPLAAGCTPDHLTMPPGEPAVPVGPEFAAWHEARDAFGSTAFDWTAQGIEADGDLAVVHWTGQITVTPRDGSAPVSDQLTGLWVWKRSEDGRRLLHWSTWNSDLPADS